VSPKTILIVDDDPDQHATAGMFLQHSGYRVLSAYDRAGALEAVRTEQPDLVLMDLRLRYDDGLAVAHVLRAQPGLESVPVVVVTADVLRVREGVRLEDVDAVVLKPCVPRDLLDIVRKTIGAP
jgi:CheY-like chemotaxis protein